MVFLGIYRAIYDYVPQSENEIALAENDLLMVLEKSADDDWWKAKKKGSPDDEDEPEGLIPNNYVTEAPPIQQARALYDYTRQTDEELSFQEDALLDVYDISDPDWTLVGLDGDYGFAPANYIDVKEGAAEVKSPALPGRPHAPAAAAPDSDDEQQLPTPDSAHHDPSPAAHIAGIIKQQQTGGTRSVISPPPNVAKSRPRVQFTPEESDDETAPTPRLPQRPPSESFSPTVPQFASPRSPDSPPRRSQGANRSVTFDPYSPSEEGQPHTPLSGSGYHLYNIYEYLTHSGKNKKMPMTLGINIPKGMIMIAPEKSRDGPQQEWSADHLELYSQEGKHVFIELKRPSKSVDFHCGAKDTASEIMSALGELRGMARGEGIREVLAAGSGHSNVQKTGRMQFDFMAQGDDEVTVGIDDEVLILDDSASDEWWKVRRLKNGKEGVVPSNYVEITDSAPVRSSAPTSARSGINAGRSVVDQNRLDEEEMARQASKRRQRESDVRTDQVGPGLPLPQRGSSLMQANVDRRRTSQRTSKRDSTKDSKSAKPNPARIRTWTDRSGSFKVEAEFLTIRDGKIHLHKTNGVKIAVPVPKMAIEDLEYVERATGISLDDDKPLSDIKRRSTLKAKEQADSIRSPTSGISVEQKPKYDWFDFFLQCGVNPQICERYARAFIGDQMGEENLPDITDKLLRTLGLKEGDILRVTKFLDSKFGRTGDRDKRSVSFGNNTVIDEGDEANGGGLFSGPGGVLRNNTRKGRPAPPVQTNDVVDAKAFESKTGDTVKRPAEATSNSLASATVPGKKADGFEDNAWDVKPSRQVSTSAPSPTPAPAPAPASAPAPAAAPTPASSAPVPSQMPALTGSLGELSILMPALTPEIPAQPASAQASQSPPQQAQPTGATPSLFDQVAAVQSLPPQQLAPPRTRPQAPQQQGQGSLIAPPPMRSSSAPMNPQQSAFGPPPPLQPQLTGFMGPNMSAQVAPPGQSLQELNTQRIQQQMAGFPQQTQNFQFQQQNGIMPQPTGYSTMPPPQQQQAGFGSFQQPQPTGFQPGMQPSFPTGMQQGFQPGMPQGFPPNNMQQGFPPNGTPFADPPRAPFQPMQSQPTGFNSFSPSPLNPQATGINRFLPPAIQPTVTGYGQTQSPPPMPPMPPMPSMPQAQPLVAQKTGPAPQIRFGTQTKKLVPQPTGRANLANATPQNPFGF